MGLFLGEYTPCSSPRGGLGFWGESRVPLDFIQKKILHLYNRLGRRIRAKRLGNPF
jgi:hypothetical protein